ncbi:MAG: DUF6492 family protein [Pseudomonadota bacterium]
MTALAQARNKLALHWGRRVLSRFVRDDPRSALPVTLMMPLAPKDIARARRSIPLIRSLVAHPIDRFLIVAPASPDIADMCAELEVDFVDETAPLVEHLGNAHVASLRGWYRQQFLKLLAPEVTGAERVLTFDSDTHPIRPTAFTTGDGRTILYRGDRNLLPFHRFTEALIGPCPEPETSFVAHCMLFEADALSAMRDAIAKRQGCDWISAIMQRIGKPETGILSEFDLYGHFLLRERAEHLVTRYYANIKVSPAQFAGSEPLPGWKRRFRFVSNHAH